MSNQAPIKILFCCTGVGIYNRGIESFFHEAFHGLKDVMTGIECRLLKGAGPSNNHEKTVFCLPRTGKLSKLLGYIIKRSSYVVEQLSSFPGVVLHICKYKPDVIFYSDANLGYQLYFWRKWIGVPYKLLFSNGGPICAPFDRTDYVHQVAPLYLQEAIKAGESCDKHFLIPYGINMTPRPIDDSELRRGLRQQLRLPIDRWVILSVGWISREHKRMDYVIEEVAKMHEPRPFLQLLGAVDEQSPEIVALGNRLLGPGNFSVKSVPYEQVSTYYQAADCFVLGSLKEGFGRVYLEALMHGLPVIAHQHPVMEYVLNDEGLLGDLSKDGNLSKMLEDVLKTHNTESKMSRRWQSVRDRFSWSVLAPEYAKMFKKVAHST